MGEFSTGVEYKKLFWRFYLKTTRTRIDNNDGTVTNVESITIRFK